MHERKRNKPFPGKSFFLPLSDCWLAGNFEVENSGVSCNLPPSRSFVLSMRSSLKISISLFVTMPLCARKRPLEDGDFLILTLGFMGGELTMGDDVGRLIVVIRPNCFSAMVKKKKLLCISNNLKSSMLKLIHIKHCFKNFKDFLLMVSTILLCFNTLTYNY